MCDACKTKDVNVMIQENGIIRLSKSGMAIGRTDVDFNSIAPAEFKEAFDIVAKQLREDIGYYIAWQANIAVAFQDTLSWAGYQFPELHKLSNDAAKRFIDLLISKSE